jgi:hypothetical protein
MPAVLASQQVIDAMAAVLVAAGTGSGARVHTDRFHPVAVFPSTKLLHVNEDLQTAADDLTWPPIRLHQLQVDVRVLVNAPADIDTAMSTAALQVMQALQGSASPLAPLPVDLAVQGISYQSQTDGQAATGEATVRFEAQFQTAAHQPETII